MEHILTGKRTFYSLDFLNLNTCTKKEIKDYFINSYDINESLFLGLKDDSVFYLCPDRLRLPLIFYYAHTAVVYINKLILAGLIKERVNLSFETMFETGVDEQSWDDTENYRMGGSYNWPSVKEVVDYRRTVRNIILQLIDETPLELPITQESPWWAVMMGLDHERLHIETSSVLLRQLPLKYVQTPKGWKYAPKQAEKPVKVNRMIKCKPAEVTLGKPTKFPNYGWDNEYGLVKVQVPAFEASEYLVTNKEFLKFVEAGGYHLRKLWTDEGWNWVKFRQARHPTFWTCNQGCKSGCGGMLARETHCRIKVGDANQVREAPCEMRQKIAKCSFTYSLRLEFDEIELPMDWPVEVNYHEAKAFCAWKGQGYRMPVEAEHHVMRANPGPPSEDKPQDIYLYGDKTANLHFRYGSPTPVNLCPPTKTGHYDVYGNLWEWVEDHFNGFSSFKSHFLYDDFSTNAFGGKHNLMMGGSWISTGVSGTPFYRNNFRRHFFQQSGFRLARSLTEDLKPVELPVHFVETEVFVLGEGVEANKVYLDNNILVRKYQSKNLHFSLDTQTRLEASIADEYGSSSSFSAVVSDFCDAASGQFKVTRDSAVHVGSSTGRVAFELSKTFSRVLGVEMCGRLVDASIRLKKGQKITSSIGKVITVNTDYNPDRIVFKQLTWLPNEVESHDLVLITHLERVQNVKAWLVRLWEITRPGGVAIIACRSGTVSMDTMQHHLHHRMKCLRTEFPSYVEDKEEKTMLITAWSHK